MAVTRPYDGLAAAWDTAAARVYVPLAVSLVRTAPIALAGKLVLDLGSGTGALAKVLDAEGARVVVADCSLGMVAHGSEHGWMPIVADAIALPVKNGAFDAVTAGFLLNHLSPARALTEIARVVRAGGVVVASTWASSPTDPVKAAVTEVIGSWGWQPPAWYETMKSEFEPIAGDPDRLVNAAQQAGLVEVRATVVNEDLGFDDPGAFVAYRLATPQIAAWVAGLGEAAESELVVQLCSTVARHLPGWRPSVIQLTARVPSHPR